jgi:hypothetical protein
MGNVLRLLWKTELSEGWKIATWRFPEPLMSDLDQLFSIAEEDGPSGAGIGAARVLTLSDPRIAHGAADNPWREGLAVLIGEGVVGTGEHTIATANAEILVIEDRPLWRLVEGFDKADRGAAGLVTVHTLVFSEDRRLIPLGGTILVDDCIEPIRQQPRLIKGARCSDGRIELS